jgi:hypothetical protein
MKKILFISKYLSTNKNGFETRLAFLIRLFKKKNFRVAAITSSNSLVKHKFKKRYNLKKINNVDYYFIKEKKNYSNYSIERIKSWINFEYYLYKFDFKSIGFRPDIIYVSSLSLITILNGIYLKNRFNAKLVFEMRDFWPYFLYTTGKFSRFNPFILVLDLIEKIGIYNSDLIISLIPKISEYLAYRGFPNKKCLSSTFPINREIFTKNKKNFFYLDKSKFNICYAGNFGFDNHLESLLKLIKETKNKSFYFHFIGSGSQKKNLQKKYSSLNNCKFYNHIINKDLHSVLSKMDCLILSFGLNKKYPLFGYELNKLNNYLMAGKPIVALGSKKNLLKERGNFIFITSDSLKIFENKLRFVKQNYKYFLKIALLNKIKLLKRNNPYVIFKQTVKELNRL